MPEDSIDLSKKGKRESHKRSFHTPLRRMETYIGLNIHREKAFGVEKAHTQKSVDNRPMPAFDVSFFFIF